MRKLILCLSILFVWGSANAQSECPATLVCISPEAARKALQDSDTVKAQSAELAAKDIAISDFRAEITTLKIELAKMSGDKTGAEQMIVRLTAIVDILLKSTKKKCMPLSICIN